jgi:hypothetical protein
MNTTNHPTPDSRIPRLRLLSAFLLAAVATALPGQAQTQSITVNGSSVVRQVPAGLGGVCVAGDFWNSVSPNYRDNLVRAKIGLVRITGFPRDTTDPTKLGSVEALDRKVAQIINAGATPLFIQCIEGESSNSLFKNALLQLNGTPYPSNSTATMKQRVATNMTYLVNRYRAAPYNLTTQCWEVGNEPDIAVNYQVATAQEYIDFFQAAHNQLVASGVRNNVQLAGPVVSWDYGFGGFRDTIMQEFLTDCRDQVDIVTRHTYALIYSWENLTYNTYNLLNAPAETAHFNAAQSGSRGEGALLTLMQTSGVETSVGTGVTEMNLFHNVTNANGYRFTITQGLWFLLTDHYSLYNPRSQVNTGFQFDIYSDGTGGGYLGFFDGARNPSFAYWAAYIHGVLTGNEVLAQSSSNSHLVVTATRDPSYIYVQVLNRHDTTSFPATITLNNSGGVGTPTEFTLSATQNPLTGTATSHGTTFTQTFAPLTAKVFRFPRNSAPTPPTPPAPPTTTHFTTSFDSSPTGIQIYNGGTAFTPVISSSRLHLTHTVANTRGAVVFNGQPLPAARTRAQVRFGFHVVHPNAEGFVFGAYSASPGAVGGAGQALGYHGQNNRLWGVKIDNNPDQISVIANPTDATVDGWSTQPITPYNGTDMFMVIDYDGAAKTVRARMYQGTSEAGTLRADVTNRVGVPSSLPAGTVFGFTGATSGYTQTTYINDLTVRADNGSGGTFVVGQEVIVDNAPANQTGTWVTSTVSPGYYGSNYSHDNATNKGACTTTYVPTLTGTGPRDVYVRYISGSTRASNAPYTVNHAGGSTTVRWDQRTLGGQWVLIGRWTFNHGTSGSVVLGNDATTGFVIADAIRFVNVAP